MPACASGLFWSTGVDGDDTVAETVGVAPVVAVPVVDGPGDKGVFAPPDEVLAQLAVASSTAPRTTPAEARPPRER
ncbi:hypothetical protein GCM10009839_88830 [Catenulispora yoronensis]|uniref:Uncharacterized protein n=1 Tax=Catenulispora yoronensis TaxID=450799 RepID=A0ABN2VNY0_9ACTN